MNTLVLVKTFVLFFITQFFVSAAARIFQPIFMIFGMWRLWAHNSRPFLNCIKIFILVVMRVENGSNFEPNSFASPGGPIFCPIFMIFGMWHPWSNISGIAIQFFRLAHFGGQEGRKTVLVADWLILINKITGVL